MPRWRRLSWTWQILERVRWTATLSKVSIPAYFILSTHNLSWNLPTPINLFQVALLLNNFRIIIDTKSLYYKFLRICHFYTLKYCCSLSFFLCLYIVLVLKTNISIRIPNLFSCLNFTSKSWWLRILRRIFVNTYVGTLFLQCSAPHPRRAFCSRRHSKNNSWSPRLAAPQLDGNSQGKDLNQ